MDIKAPTEKTPMLDSNIKQFIAAARQHFFGLLATPATAQVSSTMRTAH